MKNNDKKRNPSCPVAGCKTKQPHRSENHVDALMRVTELPHLMCQYVIEGLAALGQLCLRQSSEPKRVRLFDLAAADSRALHQDFVSATHR